MVGLDERADAERGTRDRLGGTVLGRPCVSLRRGRRSLELCRCGPRSIAGPSPWLVAPRWGHPRRPRRSSPSSGCAMSGRTSQSRSTSLPRRAGAQPRGCSPGARCSLYPPGEQNRALSNTLMNEQASKSSPTSRHDDPPPHALRAAGGPGPMLGGGGLARVPHKECTFVALTRCCSSSRAAGAIGVETASASGRRGLRVGVLGAARCRRGCGRSTASCPVGCGSLLLTWRTPRLCGLGGRGVCCYRRW